MTERKLKMATPHDREDALRILGVTPSAPETDADDQVDADAGLAVHVPREVYGNVAHASDADTDALHIVGFTS